MRDNNLILTDNAVAADAFATNALFIGKTDGKGVWLQFKITAHDIGDETIEIPIYAKDADAGWATTDPKIANMPKYTPTVDESTVVFYVLVQTDKQYIKPYYDVAGTAPSFDIVTSVVSGVQRDTLV
jgi:hypothetical protein